MWFHPNSHPNSHHYRSLIEQRRKSMTQKTIFKQRSRINCHPICCNGFQMGFLSTIVSDCASLLAFFSTKKHRNAMQSEKIHQTKTFQHTFSRMEKHYVEAQPSEDRKISHDSHQVVRKSIHSIATWRNTLNTIDESSRNQELASFFVLHDLQSLFETPLSPPFHSDGSIS
jgi:hypothetical protein